MTDESVQTHELTDEEIEDLFTKLDTLRESLSAGQTALLGAILKAAADVRDRSAVDDRPFSEQFTTAFQASQADRVLAYAHGTGLVNPYTDAIIRTMGSSSSTSAAIIRSPGTIIRDIEP